MSTDENDLEAQEELSGDKQILLDKLSTIFDPATAIDFVSPKTYKPRKHLTIEDIKHVNYEQPEERLQRLRSMEHYQTTTQSLSRADLEASYQAFIRSQIGQQQYSRDELEQFVRNSSDIDLAKHYLDSAHEVSAHPLQSHLLFHSAKLNEQRANLLKSAGTHKSLKQLNDDLNLHEYFPETLVPTPSKSAQRHREMIHHKPKYVYPRSLHIEHRDKKYRITFLKDSNTIQCYPKLTSYSIHQQNQRNIDSLFDTDTSTVHGPSMGSNNSNTHREIFPPLSLAALKEYRPSITPKTSSASTIHIQKQHHQQSTQQRRKPMLKTDFVWEQSIVSNRHE